jgi:cardiolipin synthase
MIMGSKGKKNIKPIKESYLSAMGYARHSIYITNAYFIPTVKVQRALLAAARRGVDVRLLLPGKTDVPFVRHGSRYLYSRYLRSGIRVYEYGPAVLHAKTAVIDGCWATVGSSNLDALSFKRNLEINAVILDQNIGEEMERQFFHDAAQSGEITLDEMSRRPLVLRLLEWFFYRFRNYL